jgi:peptidoglycan hydrolase-like protein with peptidoglycan-binding domain
MTGLFYMKRQAQGTTVAALPGPAGASPGAGFDPRQMDLELWNAVKSSNNIDDYKAYLDKFPNGTFADLARSRVAGLSRPAAPAGTAPQAAPALTGEIKTAEANLATEDALGIDRDGWREVQRRLTALGFATRGLDGRVGDGTRRGISAWQAARGYPTTGYLNRLQREAIMQEAVPASRAASKTDDDEEEEKPRRRSTTATPSRQPQTQHGAPGAGSAGEFVGGVVRGVIGNKRLPF